MSKTAVITTRIDVDRLAELDRLAAAYDRSRSWIVNKLLGDALREEIEELAAIEEGIADLDAGRSISHDEMMAEIDAMVADRRKARDAA